MKKCSPRNRDRATSLRAVVDRKGGAIRADVSGDTAHAAIDALEARVRAIARELIDGFLPALARVDSRLLGNDMRLPDYFYKSHKPSG